MCSLDASPRRSPGYCALLVALGWLHALAASTVRAEESRRTLPSPSVAYAARLVIRAGALEISGRVFHRPDRECRELEVPGLRPVTRIRIVRRDLGVLWVLNPSARVFTALPATSDDDLAQRPLEELVELGPDAVEGLDARRVRVRFAVQPGGQQLSGEAWLSEQDILLRLNGQTTRRSDGRVTPFRLELRELVVAPQPDERFEIPDGYREVSPTSPVLLEGSREAPRSRHPEDSR